MTRPRRYEGDNPAAVYRDSLSRGSYWAVRHSLGTIASLLSATDPERPRPETRTSRR